MDDFRIQINLERLSRLVEPLYGDHPPQNPHLRGGYPHAGVFRVLHRGEHPAAERFVVVRTLHALDHRGRFAAEHQRVAAVIDRQHAHDALPAGADRFPFGCAESLRASRQHKPCAAPKQNFPIVFIFEVVFTANIHFFVVNHRFDVFMCVRKKRVLSTIHISMLSYAA